MSAVGAPESIAARVGNLPPMPRTAARVLECLANPDAPAELMGRIIEADPALAGAVLRLVNSALFSLPQHVISLPQAVVLIGFTRLRSLMLATVTAGLRDLVPPSAAEARSRVWAHSVGAALAARRVAERLGLDWAEEAFVGGLLHDCGRLVLLTQLPSEYQLLFHVSTHPLPQPSEEIESLGVDHAAVGAALLRYWNQAPQLIEAAELHHENHDEIDPSPMVSIVILADCLLAGHADTDNCRAAATRLGLPVDGLPALRESIVQDVAAARAALLTL